MEPVTLIVAAIAALAVLLIFLGLTGGSGVNARLERYASAPQTETEAKQRQNLGAMIASSGAMANLNRVVERRDWGANMARELARADMALKPSEFLAIRLAALIGIPLGMVVLSPLISALSSPILWLLGLVAGFFLPRLWLGRRKSKRLKAFNTNLAPTITLLANALRAGSSFLQGLEMVVRETHPPISTEFERVIREVNLGLPMEQALANISRRVRSDDLDLMVTAITIHHQVGGNLAEILDSIAFTIRERVRIKGEIKTLTAQGRMSGYVVGLLPVGLLVVLSVISPTFIEPLFMKPPEVFGLPLGVIILSVGGLLMAIGFWAIRKIVTIEV
ncbi:type II secretion system F family protein [soil metagenome]|jgi:tight adherence protein B